MWALGQIAAKGASALDALLPLLSDKDEEIRAQAARVLGDHPHASRGSGVGRLRVGSGEAATLASTLLGDLLGKLTADSSLRVRYFATMGLGRLGKKEAIGPVLKMLRENGDKDVYLRHAGMMALVWIKDSEAILGAAKDQSVAVRLAALEAMRRLEMPQVAMFLHDSDPQFVLEAARAINDVPIPEAMPQLASLVSQPNLPDYVTIRAVNANYRVGTPQAAAALAQFAEDPKAAERWRVQALRDLADWASPGHLDRVTNLPRPLPDRDPKIARDAVGPALVAILHTAPNHVRVAALSLIQKLGVRDSAVLVQLASDTKLSPDVRIGALQTMAVQNDPRLADAVKAATADKNEHVRARRSALPRRCPCAAGRIESVLGKGSLLEQQAAFDALGDLAGKSADETLASWMDKLLADQVKPELQLDVLDAASRRQSPLVQQKVQRYEQSLSKSDELAPYRVALQGGDASAGQKIFTERADVSCVRCHTVHGTGGIVGPVLDGIGAKQNREYLLESIVLPNAKIAQASRR